MVLLTTHEEQLKGVENFDAYLDKAWQAYPFPDKYNEHRIDFSVADGGSPKGSFIELINRFENGFGDLSLQEAKGLMSDLSSGKKYQEELVTAIDEVIEKNKIGNELIKKWFNIKEDGSYDYDLIFERAEYNANRAALAEANATTKGVRAILDDGEKLIGSTFVTFSKLSFYPNEPVASFMLKLGTYVASQTPSPANLAVQKTVEATYAATHKGYTAKTTTALYKLVWDEDTIGSFYSMFSEDGKKIDMNKFNSHTFKMSLVGIDNASSSTFDAKGGLAEAVGVDSKSKPADELIQQTIVRNIDKILAKMQKNYEEFAPVSQIISVNPLVADMGMKEGLEGGESFDLLEPQLNPKTNEVEWKSIGVVKVDKKQIWDNRYSITDEAKKEAQSDLQGTVLSNNKKAAVGMVVRQVVKSKKK